MQQGSFIGSNSNYSQLDEFRKDVRQKLFAQFENSKTILKKAKEIPQNSLQSLLRNSQSPKQPRTQQITPQQSPFRVKQISKHSPGRLSFQKSNHEIMNVNSSLNIPKKTLNEIVPVEKIQDLAQCIKGQSYGASDLYMQELRKLAKMILNE